MRKLILTIITALVLLSGTFYLAFVPGGREGGAVEFTVRSGEGVREIAQELSDKGLVPSKVSFISYAVISGSARRLKPGTYRIEQDAGIAGIVAMLRAGNNREITVVIPEGYTLKDIDKKLSDAGVIAPESLSKLPPDSLGSDILKGASSLEGYLFPDTYRFFPASDPKDVALRMFGRFSEKALPGLEGKKELTVHQYVTLASLIEREVTEPQDMELVSGILHKRMAGGMRLQIDATISYIKCRGAIVGCKQPLVARRDLELDSPYNTYMIDGLPPGPISNPGLSAIKAAANPKNSQFYYYLSDPRTGQTHYSVTLDEHNEKRLQYLLN